MERLKVRRPANTRKIDLIWIWVDVDWTGRFHFTCGGGTGVSAPDTLSTDGGWMFTKPAMCTRKKKTVSKGVGRVNPTHKKLMKLQGEAANGRVEAAMSTENKLLGRSCESIKLSGSWYTLPISRTNARDGSIGSRKPWPRCSCNRN